MEDPQMHERQRREAVLAAVKGVATRENGPLGSHLGSMEAKARDTEGWASLPPAYSPATADPPWPGSGKSPSMGPPQFSWNRCRWGEQAVTCLPTSALLGKHLTSAWDTVTNLHTS